jgi:hypothetical protein
MPFKGIWVHLSFIVEQNLPTLQEHLSSSQFYSGAEPDLFCSTIKLRWTQMFLKGRQVLLHYKTEMNSDALEGLAGSAPL